MSQVAIADLQDLDLDLYFRSPTPPGTAGGATLAPTTGTSEDFLAPSETTTAQWDQQVVVVVSEAPSSSQCDQPVVVVANATPPASQCDQQVTIPAAGADVATSSPPPPPPQLNNVDGGATLMQLRAFLSSLIPLCQGNSSLGMFLWCFHALLDRQPPPPSLSTNDIIQGMTSAYLALLSNHSASTASSSSSSAASAAAAAAAAAALGGQIQKPVTAVAAPVSVVPRLPTESSGANDTVVAHCSSRRRIQEPYTKPQPKTTWYTCTWCPYKTPRGTDMKRHMHREDHVLAGASFAQNVICDRLPKSRSGSLSRTKKKCKAGQGKQKRRS